MNIKQQYYLDFDGKGAERRYAPTIYGNPKHTLHVFVEGEWETTTTSNIEHCWGAFSEIYPVAPRGAGWEVYDDSHDKRTVWRRRVVR